MILHPAVIALLSSSALTTLLALAAALFAVQILRRWDLRSGSELQLELERRTYFIATVLALLFGSQLVSLFLLVFTADNLSPLITGAMCAAGVLQAGSYGYPLLYLKVVNFLLAGLWLIVNAADNRGFDYPLIKVKYAALLVLTPLVAADTALLIATVRGLQPDVITSCCGSLFSGGRTVAADLAALPPGPMKMLFGGTLIAVFASGIRFLASGRGARLYALAAFSALAISLAAVLSFISPYVYELPTHHCPFCLLQREYGYVGYLLYAALFCAAVTGMGAGVLSFFAAKPSLAAAVPAMQKTLVRLSLVSFALFALVALYRIAASALVM